jgi:hypothetical protein
LGTRHSRLAATFISAQVDLEAVPWRTGIFWLMFRVTLFVAAAITRNANPGFRLQFPLDQPEGDSLTRSVALNFDP